MILITGATGFLGAELAIQLASKGLLIRCTKRVSSVIPDILKPFEQQIEWVEADLLDIFSLENALVGVVQVYHCAALVSFKPEDKIPMRRVNVNGTANVVTLCLQQQIRLLHVSSIAAIGDAKPGELITENNFLEVTSKIDGYALSKLEGEMEVWRGIAEGLEAIIVNPAIIIGKNAGTAGSGKLFETVRQGLKFYTSGSCGFVDVEDVARCMIALMNTNLNDERFILNAENITFKQLFLEIAQKFGTKPPSIYARSWMLEIGWRAASIISLFTRKPPFLDKVSAQASSRTNNYDNAKIREAIGITFKPLSRSIAEICMRLAGGN
jgi:nucleoside-diphosphate-sugar epimerase